MFGSRAQRQAEDGAWCVRSIYRFDFIAVEGDQVIGNVVEIIHHTNTTLTRTWRWRDHDDQGNRDQRHIQLQQDPVRVAVDEALLALQAEVLLEGPNSFGVVSFEAADDLGDLGRALLWIFMLRARHDARLCF